VEARQILNILIGTAKPGKNGRIAWENHPAVKMWRGYENCLAYYMNTMISVWEERGYKNNMGKEKVCILRIKFPWWLGDEEFHASHRANLLRKDYEYYSKFGWTEDTETAYFWPV